MSSNTIKLSLFLCLSMCLGIGILRFSYTALLPGTREAFAWTTSFASLLGSANLLGYLIGAFTAMRLPQDRSMAHYIQMAAIAGVFSLLCCAFSGFSEIWYISWRVISGISGGLLMILSPSVVAQCCDLQDRLKINFIGFSGIGLGVLVATLFLPYLDQMSIQTAWLILCGFALFICLCLSLLLQQFKPYLSTQAATNLPKNSLNSVFYSLLTVYACSAFAYIPHSLFWVDYLSHQLELSLFWINFNWILYGLGSALGALTAYALARKFGNFSALKILYSLYIVAILLATAKQSSLLTFGSSFFTGLLNPAVVFLTSYTILQLYGLAYKKLWSIATLCFAAVQLIGGLSFSALQYLGLSYYQQFVLAACVLLLGALQLFWCTRPARLKSHESTRSLVAQEEGSK
ncbi:YbfB/YjiJ family MFS transporter [Acinetobacter sp. RF15A]|uniref:YbfB/YjiJ family MFS transporter n=1 Tax=unclassified Acinetobacter TaxID=196816 RepID=UPI001191270A|nr:MULTISPECIES: YbfB/YjiJ family MFS transporter [unclassified Acinetobacter]TSH77064.1 YbfB/YjiJ family MFS transporter [Acinetobacter sp. RF15A]TSI18964.1 YbfB/YjiJ family MFS transporter [Acinetobacter sp. RF15B]